MGPQKMGDDSTKSKILEAAGPIFAARGFRGATVREICDEAGVNVASINYHFGDKSRLYLETVRFARNFRAEQFPFPSLDRQIEPRRRLEGFITTLLRRLVSQDTTSWHVRLLTREMMHPTEACREVVEQYFNPMFERLLEIVDLIVGRRLPEYRRQQIGFSVIGQCLFYRFAGGLAESFFDAEQHRDQFNTDALAKHITSFCFAALQNIKTTDDTDEGSQALCDVPPSTSETH